MPKNAQERQGCCGFAVPLEGEKPGGNENQRDYTHGNEFQYLQWPNLEKVLRGKSQAKWETREIKQKSADCESQKKNCVFLEILR